MKRITCRLHKGTFDIVPRRGRPPVNCNEDNPCTKAGRKPSKAAPLPEALTPPRRLPRLPTANEVRNVSAKEAAAMVKPAESPVEPSTGVPASVAKALEAKGLLDAQGWTCHAKRLPGDTVEFHASRGTERIAMVINANGVVTSQDYSLWDTQKDSTNGMPPGARKLPFNPDEMTDSELAKAVSERQLIWWNRISGKEETAACPAKVQITHTFNGHEDEVPGDRVITFIDMHGSGYRTLRQGALMRLDK